MQRFTKTPIVKLLIMMTMFVAVGCNKHEDSDVRVTTYTPQDITETTAKCGGDVIVTQGLALDELGVCWSKERNPTVADAHRSTVNWSETFVCIITGLEPDTKYHIRAYALRGLEYYYGDDKSFTTLGNNGGGGNGGDGGLNGYEYVDLGLPSGTLWATCNVGAYKPEDNGLYFAWGETQPKNSFDWSNYQYCMGTEKTLTKYCNNSNYGYNGFTDNLTILLPEDDAATVNWGADWRMPTKEEWEELYNNTTVTWVTQNGVNGTLLTSANGNSLFLPAAGYCWDSSVLYYYGIVGFYWSRSLDTDYPSYAWSLNLHSNGCYISDYYYRHYGFSVRPVCYVD